MDVRIASGALARRMIGAGVTSACKVRKVWKMDFSVPGGDLVHALKFVIGSK